jgi:sulfate adenylyltransferase subunit 1
VNISELNQIEAVDLLRFSTAGSVDDGKSTLIGRLLYDSKSIFEDQIAALTHSSKKRGGDVLDLSLLTDGLVAEREQGITIDVAYRYFATPVRKFIIADTPGHEQYTRNMVTGASTADLAVVLVDVSKGISVQSKRHALIAHLLGIAHIVVAVNKMDLVQYSRTAFDALREEFSAFAEKLGVANPQFIPLSALHGDMVVERGENLLWYDGPTLLELLERVRIEPRAEAALRFPVQLVSRPTANAPRGYMGKIASGSLCEGDRITVLPSGESTWIKEIVTFEGNIACARAPQPVTLLLQDEIDISRGDVIVHAHALVLVARTLEAQLCWMDGEALSLHRKYLVKHTTRTVKAMFTAVRHRVAVQTLELEAAGDTLRLNEIGQVSIKLQQPLMADAYRDNRATGSFIVIDEATNHTVAAGMVL